MKKLLQFFKQMDRKTVRIILFSLAGVLAAAAVTIFVVLYSEGVTAGSNAQAVLLASGLTPEASASVKASDKTSTVTDVQLEATPSPQPTLEPELKGYSVVARIDIDKIDQHLPVLAETVKGALKVSVCYYEGTMPGEDGNMVVTGHNYANGAHFGKLDKLEKGDTVLLTGKDGTTQTYTVYEIDHIKPDDSDALGDTEYARELTLLTCESHGNGRLVVRCKAQ